MIYLILMSKLWMKGKVLPHADDMGFSYLLTGNATISGVGNGSLDDASSFQHNPKKIYQGRGLVIIRPKGQKDQYFESIPERIKRRPCAAYYEISGSSSGDR
jgi:Glycoside hydrolase family 2 C-terminal domain 5